MTINLRYDLPHSLVNTAKDLPDLDFSLAGFEAIIDQCRAHVPRNPNPYESIPSQGLSVRIIK